MAAPFTRSHLGRGPALVTFNSGNFFTRDDFTVRHDPSWDVVPTSMYGEVDKAIKDRVIKIPLKLWGAWENLTVLFPSAVLNPNIGASVYGTTDITLTVTAKNGDTIVYTNAQLTKLANLHLGTDSDTFSADVEFTCLCGGTANPEDANAYYTLPTGNSYTDSLFAKTNFKRTRWTAAWGSKTGFTSFVAQKGFDIDWSLDLKPVAVDGWGTRDMTIAGFVANAKCIPVGPTLANLEAAAQAQGAALGGLLSVSTANLVITGAAGGSVTLNNASITGHGYTFGIDPLRLGEVTFSTVRGFTTGAPTAIAAIS